jgi:hypothetical protein
MKKFFYLTLFPILSAFAQDPAPIPPEEVDLFDKTKSSFILNGEFLYWTVHEGALDYAIKMRKPAWSETTPSYAQGDFKKAKFDWDPGFRLSFGYFRALNFWEMLGQWTRLFIDGTDRTKRPCEDKRYLNGTFPQVFLSSVQNASSHIRMHYDTWDFFVHRVFHPENNPHLRLRLIGGLTGAWIKQRWMVHYYDIVDNLTTMSNKWRYLGIGLKAGIGFDWFIVWDFYLTGKYTTALLIGRYHNFAKQKTTAITEIEDDPNTPIRDTRYKDYRFAFTNQLFLGPSYQKSFSCCRLEIFAGYEFTLWSNLHEVFRSNKALPKESKQTEINNGYVALHGLTTRLTLNL